MRKRVSAGAIWGLAVAVALLAIGCGDGNGDNSGEPTAAATHTLSPTAPAPTVTTTPTPTPTQPVEPTPTATETPETQSGVRGLIVVRGDVAAGPQDVLGAPPERWASEADMAVFDRAMAGADWTIDGAVTRTGLTGSDGRFTIRDLPPGVYTLTISKTLNGNVIPLSLPFTVGDDGNAEVLVEVGLGLVRTTIAYSTNGVQVREVRGPYGGALVIHDGRIQELSDGGRRLIDADGDGGFDMTPCGNQYVQACGDTWSCPGGLWCQCVASCPFCDDCGPGVCTRFATTTPYRCDEAGGCSQPGDRCVCVPSCPDCRDCARQICVPSCDPVEIERLSVTAPAQVVVGRQAQASAVVVLSDGSAMDVTTLVTWASSNAVVATVDSWGGIRALAIGETNVTARLAAVESLASTVSVVARPTLQTISVHNQSCYCRPVFAAPPTAGVMPCLLGIETAGDLLPVPWCRQVVQIGGTLQFAAIGQFADGSYEDITRLVSWQVSPPAVGDVSDGLFTARSAGTAQVTAALEGVTSDPTEVRVVAQPTLVSLSIYPGNWGYRAVDVPGQADASPPCFDCGVDVTVLRGDRLMFQATAQYDTGEWRDVTSSVTWRSSDTATATIDGGGAMSAVAGGEVVVDATLDGLTSNPVNVRVVNEATLQSIYIYQEGTDRVVGKGDQRYFRATGYYDVGISRDVTAEAAWRSSDTRIGSFEAPGVFSGHAAGDVQVWAELAGQASPPLGVEVFETSELAYCDPARVNRGVWSDNFNRVVLESDCDTYTAPGLVTLRYTVTETQPHGGIFDPCLDLYVYDGDRRVRTIREEGCGEPFLAAGAPERDAVVLKYQLQAFWDLKDDRGAPVPSGTYTVYGRFYLYYDPVVQLQVTVLSDGHPLPTRTPTAVPTPVPGEDGFCVHAVDPERCDASVAGSRRQCCELAQVSLSPLPFWWCPATQVTADTRQCGQCAPPCDSGQTPPPAATDRTTLERLYADVEALAQDRACEAAAECAATPLGAKPCGGPWRYLVYSTRTVDAVRLQALVERLAIYEGQYNVEHGIISDCSLAAPADPACVNRVCVDRNLQ